ncbi:hypothetical protein [Ornithinimicrobium kibberense]|uniref:hypothetical protein n=1 Tax=Ornithinimicrobium kibberense TaxID=282060 RepID=UPI00361DFA21
MDRQGRHPDEVQDERQRPGQRPRQLAQGDRPHQAQHGGQQRAGHGDHEGDLEEGHHEDGQGLQEELGLEHLQITARPGRRRQRPP